MAKAWKIPSLNTGQNLKICLPRILRTRFNEMNSYEKRTIEGKGIDSLHDMRVAARRIQAVLKVFRAYYPAKKYYKEYIKMRTLIRNLGEVRHFDVFIQQLEKYSEKLNGKDKQTFDMLIIRQKALRQSKRKILITYIRLLNRSGFKEKFSKFILTA